MNKLRFFPASKLQNSKDKFRKRSGLTPGPVEKTAQVKDFVLNINTEKYWYAFRMILNTREKQSKIVFPDTESQGCKDLLLKRRIMSLLFNLSFFKPNFKGLLRCIVQTVVSCCFSYTMSPLGNLFIPSTSSSHLEVYYRIFLPSFKDDNTIWLFLSE